MKSLFASFAVRIASASRVFTSWLIIMAALSCFNPGTTAAAAAKPAAPSASFSAKPTKGQAPVLVTFTDSSTGNIKSRVWDFGDGSGSTSKNPTHVYKKAGKYSVALTVTGSGGSDTELKSNYITVQAAVQPPPVEPPVQPPVEPPVQPPVEPPVQPPTTPASDDYHQIHVDSTAHHKFGLYYPATYKFRLPAGASNLSAQYRTGAGSWQPLPEKGPLDFFNGIEAARFDYGNGFAYLSARFSPASDDLYLRAVDASGQAVALTFDSIPQYYDERKAAVTMVLDDWNLAFDAEFNTAIGYLIARNMFFSVAVIAADVNYASVQQRLNLYPDSIEVLSHSLHHACDAAAYTANGYSAETAGSRDALNANLSYKNKPYIPAYVEPCGYSDATLISAISSANYLVTRSSNDFFGTGASFIPWDDSQGRYGRAGVVYNDDRDGDTPALLTNANAGFDRAVAAGGIYALMDHPEKRYWHDGSYLLQHIDHIQGRTDLWYVPFGQLYQYHFLQEKRGNLSIKHVASQSLAANFTALPLAGKSPLQVFFSDASTGAPATWLWEFGDGSVSTTQNPQHTYQSMGAYTVKLTVTGSHGSNTRTVAEYIKVDIPGTAAVSISAPPNGASFTAPATVPVSATAAAASGHNISKVDFYAGTQLIGSASAAPYSFTWTKVAAGSYTLSAELKDDAGTVTKSAPVAITVTGAGGVPGAPAITAVSAANGFADVSFSAPASDGGSPITGYSVTATPGDRVATGAASPIRVTGLSNGTAYTFRVTALNSFGSGTPSALSAPAVPLPNGDLNGDGVVGMSDGMLGLRIVLGLEPQNADHLKAGDVAPLVDGKPQPDGKIELSDVIVVLRRALGLVSW